MTLLRVIDLETTGMLPPAEILEFGRVDVAFENGRARVGRPMARLYRPLGEIPPATMAVHHITPEDIPPSAPVCDAEHLHLAVWAGARPDILVAHNAAFEQAFVGEAAGGLPWLCTLKAALHLWPEAPGYGNQTLRYWRRLALDRGAAMPPHRAGPDAYVTAHLLAELLKEATVEEMIAWTAEPRPMPTIPFGKHKGAAWSEAPLAYLKWMLAQAEMDPDVLWHAGQELERRAAGKKPAAG